MSDSQLVECPVCSRPNVPVAANVLAKHHEPDGLWCRRGGFSYRSSEGWIVLVGRGGYPVRISDEEMEVAWFPDEAGAQRWIEQHTRATSAYAIELRNWEP